MTHVAQDAPKAGLRWFPLNVGTALVLATVISLVAFMLLSDGEGQAVAAGETQPVVLADSLEPALERSSSPIAEESAPVTTTIAAAEASRSQGGFDRGSGGDAAFGTSAFEESQSLVTPVVVAMSSSEFGSGPTEVALVTNFPAVDYSWERVALPGSGFFEMSWVGELNGTLMAINSTWDESGEGGGGQTLVTWSGDVPEWDQLSSVSLPADTWINRVIGDNDRVYAIVEHLAQESGSSTSYVMMTTSDGVTWTTDDLPVAAASNDEHMYVQDAVVGPAGIALAVQYETYPLEPPQRVVFDDYEVEIDHASSQYTLTETASGDVVLTGPIADIYNWSEVDGQRIVDPETGDELTVVPWETWEQAYADVYEDSDYGSPLPIPIDYGEPYEPPVVTIEYGGFVITLDEGAGSFVVADAESGVEVAAGSLDVLYQGPPPRLVDPDSGDVILSVTWEEWYRAEEKGWESYEYTEPEFNYSSRTAVLTSSDGVTWAEETLNDGANGGSVFLAASEDGFIATSATYGDYGEQRTIWRMSGGAWISEPAQQAQLWLYSIAHTSDGFVAIGDGATGQAIFSSSDGTEWATAFTTAPQTEGAYVWFNSVASDGAGLVGVLATHETMYDYKPLVIEHSDYTAVFEDGESAVHVTEIDSGATVLLLTWEDFDIEGGTDVVTHDGEATLFALDNGDTMVIYDTEASEAMESRWSDEVPNVGASVFLRSGNSWREAVVDPAGGFSGASQMYMSNGKIIVAGNYWGEPRFESVPSQDSAFILIGTPVEGRG